MTKRVKLIGDIIANTKPFQNLKKDEWDYIILIRNTESGIRYAKAIVNEVDGIILLPDNWSISIYELTNTNDANASFASNTINRTIWNDVLAENGAVFLPYHGYRSGTGYTYDIGTGYSGYWSASKYDANNAYYLRLNNMSLSSHYRNYGHRVRLVKNVE